MDTENTTTALDAMPGAFVASLKRNNRKIREDRAIAISEMAQTIFKREVEDIDLEIKRLKRERENMLDLSPTDAQSLNLAINFDAKEFCRQDLDLGVKIRNLEIKLEIAKSRFKHLFEN